MYSDNLGQQDLHIKAMSNTAPAPFSTSYGPEAIAGSNDLFSFGAQIGTGAISSNVDGTPGSKSSSGSVNVQFYSFSMLDILSLSGDEMSAEVSSTGDVTTFGASSSLMMSENSLLTVLGSNVALTGGVIYNSGGLMIVQQQHGQSVDDFHSANNAYNLFITFDNFAHDGDIYNGSIILGTASSSLRAVPEPSSMMVLGGLGLVAALRKRKKA